jgi:LmbE family N-acetylglucosaminyl deacetylase
MFSFSTSDRILVVAPHPDDESLGTGGLLQRIFARRIPIRIVYATNGDNNPWAQRHWEKRWHIGTDERIRWGRRRREEALAAITALGGQADCAKFINLPDLGTTALLMSGGPELSSLMVDEIQEWHPTVALIPAKFDAHPDHSALSVAFSTALESTGRWPMRVWEYLIHTPRLPITQMPVRLLLSAEEVECKYKAILRHETQVALSRTRFTRFAKTEEPYYPHVRAGTKTADLRLVAAGLHEEVLRLQFYVSWRERYNSQLLLLFRNSNGTCERWRLPLPLRSGEAKVWDTTGIRPVQEAIIQWRGSRLFVDIPVAIGDEFDTVYAKFCGWKLFFDRSGWSQAAVSARGEQSHLSRSKAPVSLTRL